MEKASKIFGKCRVMSERIVIVFSMKPKAYSLRLLLSAMWIFPPGVAAWRGIWLAVTAQKTAARPIHPAVLNGT